METKTSKIIFFSLAGVAIIGAIFGITNLSHASTIYEQTADHNQDKWIAYQQTYYYWQALGNGLSGNLITLCLWGRSSTGNIAVDWYENNDDSNAGNINAQTKITGGGSFTTYNGVPGSNQEFCLDMSGTGVNFNPAKYYSFVINYGSQGEAHFYASGSNLWGSTTDNLYYHAQAPSDTGGDVYFKITTDYTANPNSLSINFPANTATTTDFSAFGTYYTAPNSPGYPLPNSQSLYIKFYYGQDQTQVGLGRASTATTTLSQRVIETAYVLNLQPGTNYHRYISKTYDLASSTYYALAELYDSNGNLLITSPETSFTIISGSKSFQSVGASGVWDNASSTYNLNPTSIFGTINPEASSSIFYVDCSNESLSSSTMSTLLCYSKKGAGLIGAMLFQPSAGISNFFQNQLSEMTHVFPFNLFFGLNYILENQISINSSSTPRTITASIWGQNIEILSSSTLANVVGTTQKNDIFSLIVAGEWAFAALLIYLIVV